ncbi:MAG: hypothetical protein J6V26_05310 [Alistipes sp.]|nr:hypothetical protein [Alistipes sp.]
MTPYQQSIEAAKSWKEAVGAMWKRQRTMLFLGIACIALLLVGLVMLCIGLVTIDESQSVGTPLIVTSIIIMLMMLVPAIVSVVMLWIFYFDVKRWQNAAPESLKKSIKLFSLGLLITLIASVAASVIGGFTTIPYIGVGAQMLNSLIECAAIAGAIIEFIAIIKLRKANDMPELAKQGAHCIFINYIISWAVAAIGTIIMIFAAVALAFSVFAELDDAGYNDSEVGGLLAGIDDYYEYEEYEEYDDYEEYDEIEVYEESFDISSPGFWDSLTEELTDEDDIAFFNALDDAEGAWIAFIVALLIMIGGGIVAMYYYYRGWWLISKSELPVLPEPIEDEVGEEVAYEEVENVEVVENEQ